MIPFIIQRIRIRQSIPGFLSSFFYEFWIIIIFFFCVCVLLPLDSPILEGNIIRRNRANWKATVDWLSEWAGDGHVRIYDPH